MPYLPCRAGRRHEHALRLNGTPALIGHGNTSSPGVRWGFLILTADLPQRKTPSHGQG